MRDKLSDYDFTEKIAYKLLLFDLSRAMSRANPNSSSTHLTIEPE
jgi:hypothetical protein